MVAPVERHAPSQAEEILGAMEAAAFLGTLSPEEQERLPFHWPFWARPSQLPPDVCGDPECGCDGAWRYWLIMAGRGFGKTRTGMELFRAVAPEEPLTNLIGPTFDDVAAIMLEGESGLFANTPEAERPVWKQQKHKLIWPNGAVSMIYTADEPDRLRGKQHRNLWCEEVAAWRYPESWTQAKLGLRLRPKRKTWPGPRAWLCTTPRPWQWLRDLANERTPEGRKLTHVTRGTSYENTTNLDPAFLGEIVRRYEGSWMGDQELRGLLLAQAPGALWKRDWLQRYRVAEAPEFDRVVVAMDPANKRKKRGEADQQQAGPGRWGISVAGAAEGHAFIVADLSIRESPGKAVQRAVDAYHAHRADALLGEVNNGGAMIGELVRKAEGGQYVNYVEIRATDGKRTRAEPISALYERGLVHHVGRHEDLEDELCNWEPDHTSVSPDPIDALVWAVHELLLADSITGEFERVPKPWQPTPVDSEVL